MNNNEIIVYTDGASRGNPGPSAIGIYIETLKKEYGEIIDNTTNNDAEYQAVVFALIEIRSLTGKKKAKEKTVKCYMDSQLVVEQLNHRYKITHPTTQKHFLTIWNLTLDFKKVLFAHIPREKNKIADKMANIALDKKINQATLL